MKSGGCDVHPDRSHQQVTTRLLWHVISPSRAGYLGHPPETTRELGRETGLIGYTERGRSSR
jgi:hypothetical protein